MKASKGPVFSSRVVALVLSALKDRGIDTLPLERQYEIETTAGEYPECKLRLGYLTPLLDDAARLANDDFFGVTVAQTLPRGQYGLIEFALRAAQNMDQVFASLARYASLVNDSLRFSYQKLADGSARFEHEIPGLTSRMPRQLSEYTLALLLHNARGATQEVLVPISVELGHPAPPNIKPLVEFFGTPNIRFGAPFNSMHFSAHTVGLKVHGGDPALREFLERRAIEALAARPSLAAPLTERVRQKVRELLSNGDATIERVAYAMKLSARTLQRHLSEEGTSFQDVLDEVRHALAAAYLRDQKLGVAEVAYLLGYSELRSFDRAFRRWTGQAPGAWRS